MLTSTAVIACGNCVHSSIWYRFPAIDSCVWIFPLWIVVLSGVRTFGNAKLRLVPSFPVTLILVFLILLLAPAMIGPPLGFWIPISCIAGTWSAFKLSKRVKTAAVITATVAVVAQIGFGFHDYAVYKAMTHQERLEFVSPLHRPNVEAPANSAPGPQSPASMPYRLEL